MKKRLLFAVILSLSVVAISGATSEAADLKPIFKSPPKVPTSSWTGFYFGAHFGAGWGKKTWIDNFPTVDGDLDAAPRVRGWLAGLQTGYNYQINRWLLVGMEGEFSWSGMAANFSCFSFGDQICSAKSEWIGSLTGRAGVIFGPSIVYLKGGVAWVSDRYFNLATCAGSQPKSSGGISADCGNPYNANETRPGWTVAGGVEYRFAPSWSLRFEYDYADFGKRSVLFTAENGNRFTEEIHQHASAVKVGLNYFLDPVAFGSPPLQGSGWALREVTDGTDKVGKVEVFAGLDVGRQTVGGWVAALLALSKDSDTSGGRVYILGGAGHYRYSTGGTSIRGRYEDADVLAGYGFEGDNYSINLLAGLNLINHTLSEPDITNSVQGTQVGAKARASAYSNPSARLMIYGEVEYSTAFKTFYTSGKVGYDLSNNQIFIGPEISYRRDQRSDELRVGGHISGLKLGRIEIDLSGGYADDSIIGRGAYARMETNTHF